MLRGFICPKGFGNVAFDYCRDKCPAPCHPLPVLGATIRQREVVQGVYSVTEILKPWRQIYLARHKDFWVTPESQMFMLNGSGVHSLIEGGGKTLGEGHLIEQRGEAEVLGAKLRGTFDYYDGARKTLWDFKTANVYSVKKLKAAAKDGTHWQDEDYFAQLNIYRAYFCPEAEKLRLWCLVQGWTQRDKAEVKSVEQIDVPVAPIEEVKQYVEWRMKNILEHEASGVTPECSPKDRWMDNRAGKPTRCLDYCPVNMYCETHQKWLAGHLGEKNDRD